ncbi:MAG: ATP-dependent acyl-CoA ligase [Actinobacteria bacterium]|nr:ATP-dependent acyl-CoA ligase [Actinomycetota bacterium]
MIDRSEVLPNRLAARAAATPQRVYVRAVDGEAWTYADLEERVRMWATRLAGVSVHPGDRVIVMLPSSATAIAVWLAIARLGGVEVPVNIAYRGRFLVHLVTNAGAAVAVVDAAFVDRFAEVEDEIPDCQQVLVVGGPPAAGLARIELRPAADVPASPVPELAEPDASEIATILYTSGTTGASKGVLVTWEQVHWTASRCPPLEGRDESDVFYSPFPLFHMSGKLAVCAAAILGGEIVIRSSFSTSEFWSDVDRYGVTTALLIGSTANFVAKLPARPEDADHSLRNVLIAPPPDDVAAFNRRFGVRCSAVFNMTELSCPISTGWDQELLVRGSVGRVQPGYEVRLVDDLDRPVVVGEIGEIVVRADEPWRLMQGYWGMPDMTVEAWRNLWFHTGDLGRMEPDGAYFFLDRKKDAIRRRGENISSMELEAEIAEHEHVLDVAVVGVPAELGEEDVKAFVVPRSQAFTPEGLIAFLEPRVPAFMLPRYVVVLDELPRTPTEKIQKHVLKAMSPDGHTWERRERP